MLKTYRVFVRQVDRQVIEVKAANASVASTKALAEWKRNHAHSSVEDIELKEEED